MGELTCELCSTTSFMEFNCWMPSFGMVLRADICPSCFKSAESDMALAVEIIRKRAESHNMSLPMSMKEIAQLIMENH